MCKKNSRHLGLTLVRFVCTVVYMNRTTTVTDTTNTDTATVTVETRTFDTSEQTGVPGDFAQMRTTTTVETFSFGEVVTVRVEMRAAGNKPNEWVVMFDRMA